MQESDRSALNVGQPQRSGGGEGLAEKLAAPIAIARPTAGEQHRGPFQPGASEPSGGGHSPGDPFGAGEVSIGLVQAVEARGK